jgi:hypothetical protein
MERRSGVRGAAVAFAAFVLGITAPAHAGSYVVRACEAPAGHFPNRSWQATGASFFVAAVDCRAPAERAELFVVPGQEIPPGASAALTFTAPENATIADFRIDREVYNYNPTMRVGDRPPFVLYLLGTTAFAGAGAYDAAVRDRVHAAAPSHWYGYPEQPVQVGPESLSLRDFPALASYDRGAATLRMVVGCAAGGPPCSLAEPGNVVSRLFGAEVRVQDNSSPSVLDVQIASDRAMATATDNVGISRLQIVDVKDPGAPIVLADEDYAAGVTDAGARCDYTRPRPCPQLAGETIAAGLPVGRRDIAIRVKDAAGNVAVSEPRSVKPGLERRPNGVGASIYARARLWLPARGRRPTARTVPFGKRTAIAGALADGAGKPITGAVLDVLVKSDRIGAPWRRVAGVTTDVRGRFASKLAASTSRAVRVAYRAFTSDPEYASTADATIRVRAGVRFSASPRHVRNGSVITFRGRLRGGPGRRGVTVVIYAVGRRVRGQRARVPVEALRTDRHGRFAYRYRFQKIAGPFHYRFQARVRPDRGYPYAPGRSKIVHVAARP